MSSDNSDSLNLKNNQNSNFYDENHPSIDPSLYSEQDSQILLSNDPLSPSSAPQLASPSSQTYPLQSPDVQMTSGNPANQTGAGIGTINTQQPSRQFARNAIIGATNKASRMVTAAKERSSAVRYGVDTTVSLMNRFVPQPIKSFTTNQWNNYGDPLLSKLDAKLDYYFAPLVSNPPSRPLLTAGDLQENNVVPARIGQGDAMYRLYWRELNNKFKNSMWFSKVDNILLQNHLVQGFCHKMVRPAEVFYQSVTEEFMTQGNMDDFITALKVRIGPAWDDRLTPLAKGFYTTASAVSAVVGAGKFVGGALQLGKSKVHDAIDDLLTRWDRVLGGTDGDDDSSNVDQNPPNSNHLQLTSSDDIGMHTYNTVEEDDDDDQDYDYTTDEDQETKMAELDIPTNESIIAALDPTHPSLSANTKKRSSQALDEDNSEFCKDDDEEEHESFYSKRTKHTTWSDDLKGVLTEKGWFTSVDEVLLENPLVKAMASYIRPAEHFFDTSARVFQNHVLKPNPKLAENRSSTLGSAVFEQKASVNPQQSAPEIPYESKDSTFSKEFMDGVSVTLGPSWDIRLKPYAEEFYVSAINVHSNPQ